LPISGILSAQVDDKDGMRENTPQQLAALRRRLLAIDTTIAALEEYKRIRSRRARKKLAQARGTRMAA
jgi:hypothetical protein